MTKKTKGASALRFTVITNPTPVSDIPVLFEKFQITRHPDLEAKYCWELSQVRWSELDEEARDEISEIVWDLAEIVERAVARALRRRLKLVKPAVPNLSPVSSAAQSAAIQ